jgi:hypothetical protein
VATFTNLFSTILNNIKRVEPYVNFNVTLFSLSLSEEADPITGWFDEVFTESSIEMVIIPKGAHQFLTGTGLYVKTDAMGLTLSCLKEGDRIRSLNDNYYVVHTVLPYFVGNLLIFYEANLIYLPFPSHLESDEIMKFRPNIQFKKAYSPTTEYIKSECVQADGTIVAAPTGKVVTYEAGYTALALLFKNEADATTLVQKVLDAYVLLQNSDGSWYQQYDAVLNADGLHDRAALTDPTHSGDLKVDSGCALLIHAMAEWDRLNSQTRYEAVVKKGLAWLHYLQYQHQLAHGNGLISNLIYEGQVDTVAYSADTAECLLAALSALDAYGESLVDSEGYSVKTFGNDVFYAIVVFAYRGDANRAYSTTNPHNTQCVIPMVLKENISYAQALSALAVKNWSISSYNTVGDFSGQAETVLDQAGALTNGQWGGCLYVPYYGYSDENQDEYAGYSAFMCIAMQTVNPTKYVARIAHLKEFIKLMSTPLGQVYDTCDKSGDLFICKLNAPNKLLREGYGFITLTSAAALLTGA